MKEKTTASNPPAAGEENPEPALLDDEGPSADIPPFITTTNALELYDLRPGEMVSEAIARKANTLSAASDDDPEPAFLDDKSPSDDVSQLVAAAHAAYELMDRDFGETEAEAAARRARTRRPVSDDDPKPTFLDDEGRWIPMSFISVPPLSSICSAGSLAKR
jgi:hypothetical protein